MDTQMDTLNEWKGMASEPRDFLSWEKHVLSPSQGERLTHAETAATTGPNGVKFRQVVFS